MRIIYFIFFIFLSFDDCFSQDSSTYVFHLNKLPPEGVLLDKGWKFHVGDDPDYAKPDYDDNNWQPIDPILDVHNSLPPIPKAGICWFRLHLLIDSNLLNEQLALIIHQSGASEIYLSGQLIHSFGIINSNPEKIKAYDPLEKPVSFPLNKNINQVLAIRYQLQPDVLYTIIWSFTNPALQIRVNQMDTSFDQYLYQSGVTLFTNNFFRIGAFFILAVLHLSFFLYYPRQKANLFFCLYSFMQVVCDLGQPNFPHEVRYKFYLANISMDLYVLSIFFLLTALYSLLEQKRGWIYWGLLSVTIISLFLGGWVYPSAWAVSPFLINNLVNLEIVRISFKALKLKKRGAWIIMGGAINYTIFWIVDQVLIAFKYSKRHIGLTFTIGDVIFDVAILSIPVAISIYLGLEFAFTNRALQRKLKEVKELSQKAIVQEKEKQKILAAQNELKIKAMVAAQEQERKRLSRDLHDDVGTKLSALNLFLSSLDEKAKYTNDAEIRSLTQSSRQFVKETVDDVRQLLLNLSPAVLEEFGYTTAVEGLINKINETKQIHFDFAVFGINHRLKKEYELALYRITQELINNVLKHAEAKHVSLQIGQRDEKIILMMEDDGKGFDISGHKDGYGLSNLDARAKLMQGTMAIDSQPGKGTSVLVEIPYNHNGI